MPNANTNASEGAIKDFDTPFGDKTITCQRYNATNSADLQPKLIFTHGAGGGLGNLATVHFVEGFDRVLGPVDVFKGNMNLKSRVRMFETVLSHQMSETSKLQPALGGRSMGARAAVMCAQSNGAGALILVSYPLLGGKQGEDVRDQILLDLPADIDVLFVSGTADNMCPMSRLQEVRSKMKARSWLFQVQDVDHGMSLKPKMATEPMRKRSGEIAALWIQHRSSDKTEMTLSWDHEQEEATTTGWDMAERGQGKTVTTREGTDAIAGSKRKRNASQKESGRAAAKRRVDK